MEGWPARPDQGLRWLRPPQSRPGILRRGLRGQVAGLRDRSDAKLDHDPSSAGGYEIRAAGLDGAQTEAWLGCWALEPHADPRIDALLAARRATD
jgi:hypothetical protein